MNSLIDFVSQTILSGSMLLALPVAFLAGLISFASPCVLPLIPGYVGYLGAIAPLASSPEVGVNPQRIVLSANAGVISAGSGPSEITLADGAAAEAERGQTERGGRWRLTLGVVGFILGFSAVFVALAVLFAAAGPKLALRQSLIFRLCGIMLIVLALLFAGLGVSSPRRNSPRLPAKSNRPLALSSTLSGPLAGAMFGVTWSPCIGPTLAAVLSMAIFEGSMVRAAVLAFAYCLGLGVPFAAVALGMEKSRRITAVLTRHGRTIQIIGAIILALIGVLMVLGLWEELTLSISQRFADVGVVL